MKKSTMMRGVGARVLGWTVAHGVGVGIGAAMGVVGMIEERAEGAIPGYTLAGTYGLPSGAVDFLSDGRVIAVGSDGVVRVQDAVNGSGYSAVGSVDPAIFTGVFGNFGASFVKVSPSQATLAIGDNGAFNRVHLVSMGSLTTTGVSATTFIGAANTDGAWRDDDTLYVTGVGGTSVLSRLETGSLSATVVVDSIGDFSGSVAISGGRIYTGVGFDGDPISGGDETGVMRSFDLGALDGATTAVGFGSGEFAADVLSASSMDFDGFGNLLVGGGDFFGSSGDFGYAGVVDLGDAGNPLRLSPAGSGAFYGIRFNQATGEVVVMANGTGYRYAVPGPGSGGMVIGGAVAVWWRRRRPT